MPTMLNLTELDRLENCCSREKLKAKDEKVFETLVGLWWLVNALSSLRYVEPSSCMNIHTTILFPWFHASLRMVYAKDSLLETETHRTLILSPTLRDTEHLYLLRDSLRLICLWLHLHSILESGFLKFLASCVFIVAFQILD